MDGKSNESVLGSFGISSMGQEMDLGVVEVVKCSTFRWLV